MISVILDCTKDYVNEKEVDFLDICEDFYGRDVLTFTCPVCKQIHKSLRVGRDYGDEDYNN